MPDQPFLCTAFVSAKAPSSLKGKGMRSEDAPLFRPLSAGGADPGLGRPPWRGSSLRPTLAPAKVLHQPPACREPPGRWQTREAFVRIPSRPERRHRVLRVPEPTALAAVSQDLERRRPWRPRGVSSSSRVPEGKVQAVQKPSGCALES